MWNSRGCVPGRGPFLQGAGQASVAQPRPRAAGRPSRPRPPPPPAPSETNAAHGGLYGARRQRVARLTLRGKFGGGRQGALMRGRQQRRRRGGGGGCGPGRKREPGSAGALRPRAFPGPPGTAPPVVVAASRWREPGALRFPPRWPSRPGALLLCASTSPSVKWALPSCAHWAGDGGGGWGRRGLNGLIDARVSSPWEALDRASNLWVLLTL